MFAILKTVPEADGGRSRFLPVVFKTEEKARQFLCAFIDFGAHASGRDAQDGTYEIVTVREARDVRAPAAGRLNGMQQPKPADVLDWTSA